MKNVNKDKDCPRSESIGGDILRGVKAISGFIGEPVRRTFYLCEHKMIPCGKQGAMYVASKQVLFDHYARLTAGQRD
jgi:hypothetical protein